MTIQQRQQKLIQQISVITDENALTMLEETLSYHLQNRTDITDELTTHELSELLALANEPTDKNVVSLDEFKRATERWRRKL